jgi:hypothetical protein
MIPVQDFLHAQQAAVALALEKNITYEEAVRIITAQKEIENKKRIELETQMINDMGNTIVSAYDEIKNVAPDVKGILNDIIE